LVAWLTPVIPVAAQVCDIEGAANCQSFDNSDADAAISDLGLGSGLVAADDFMPLSGTITKVCWWGFYLVSDPGDEVAANDCGGQVSAEKVFRIRIYEDDDNRPGTFIAERTRHTTRAEKPAAVTNSLFTPGVKTYGFQMDLMEDTAQVDPDPITGLTPGGC